MSRNPRAEVRRARAPPPLSPPRSAPASLHPRLRARAALLPLLAREAESRVRERVEPVEPDLDLAAVAVAEAVRRAIESAQRLVDVPEETPLLPRAEERLLALHGVRAVVGHVEREAADAAIRLRLGRAEQLGVPPELAHRAPPLLEQAPLEVGERRRAVARLGCARGARDSLGSWHRKARGGGRI